MLASFANFWTQDFLAVIPILSRPPLRPETLLKKMSDQIESIFQGAGHCALYCQAWATIRIQMFPIKRQLFALLKDARWVRRKFHYVANRLVQPVRRRRLDPRNYPHCRRGSLVCRWDRCGVQRMYLCERSITYFLQQYIRQVQWIMTGRSSGIRMRRDGINFRDRPTVGTAPGSRSVRISQ